MVSALFGIVIHCFREREAPKVSGTRSARSQRGEAMKASALDQFWDTLSFLLRPDDHGHNAAMIRDFAKASGISEETIRQKLNQTMVTEGAKQ